MSSKVDWAWRAEVAAIALCAVALSLLVAEAGGRLVASGFAFAAGVFVYAVSERHG